MIRYGTSYFVSFSAACRYYRPYYSGDVKNHVEFKLTQGEIHIGKPPLKKGNRLTVIDERTRYAIEIR